MFPTVSRKRGPGFENPEPSSPKVTCIGQVRVKAKKQGKKIRGARSKRSRSGGEASFRRTEQNLQVALNTDLTRQKSQKNQTFQYQNQHQQECLPNRNQRWVHLPLTICEALKGFGAEFSCFFPCCRSSCTREKEEKAEDAAGGGRSRWLVTMQEEDAAKGMREIELVMGEKEEELEDDHREEERRHRRHVFEDIDIDDIEKMKNEEFVGKEEEEEKGRVSICIPPKNALLLMRCRSDPVKMAALANRFLEPTIHKEDDLGEVQEEEEEQQQQVPMEEDKEADNTIDESEKGIAFEDIKEASEATNQETNQVADPIEDANGTEQVETFSSEVKDEENDVVQSSQLFPTPALPAPSEPQRNEVDAKGSTEEEDQKGTEEAEEEKGSKEREKGSNLERESGTLPECLLLMMCEPKLSVEVSKETWVCTADFIRWLPPRSAGKTGGGDRQAKKRVAVESKPPLPPLPSQSSIQPGRSSCSFPAPVVGANGCESLVLTRCKSEPRESAAAKLAQEGCFWNNRKLMEPHAQARLGIGAAGVGF